MTFITLHIYNTFFSQFFYSLKKQFYSLHHWFISSIINLLNSSILLCVDTKNCRSRKFMHHKWCCYEHICITVVALLYSSQMSIYFQHILMLKVKLPGAFSKIWWKYIWKNALTWSRWAKNLVGLSTKINS